MDTLILFSCIFDYMETSSKSVADILKEALPPKKKLNVVGKATIISAITGVIALYQVFKPGTSTQNNTQIIVNSKSEKSKPQENSSSHVPNSTNQNRSEQIGRPSKREDQIAVYEVDRNKQLGEVNAIDQGTISYINSIPKNDYAILIIDSKNNPVDPVTDKVVEMYRNKGFSATANLFSSNFFSSTYLNKLMSGDSWVIDKLSLSSYANYIVIGRYASDFREGTGEYGKVVCDATLSIKVISCLTKEQVNAFPLNTSNPFDDKMHAERGVIEKLIEQYQAKGF